MTILFQEFTSCFHVHKQKILNAANPSEVILCCEVATFAVTATAELFIIADVLPAGSKVWCLGVEFRNFLMLSQ